MKAFVRFCLVLGFGLLILACQPQDQKGTPLKGQLVSPPESLFPEGASYEIFVKDSSKLDAPILATMEGTLSGGAVQLFSISVDTQTLNQMVNVEVSIYAANGLKLFHGQRLTLAAPDFSILMQRTTAKKQPMPLRTLVLECVDLKAVVRLGPGEAALFLPSRYIVLSQERAASGAKYVEGDISLWLKGDEAMLGIGESKYHCRNNRKAAIWEDAKLSGVSFRAVGNEPGWVLLIERNRLDWRYDYNESQLQLALPEPEIDDANRHTRYELEVDSKSLVLEITGQSCHDSMSGDEYEATVQIDFAGRRFKGCGKALH